MLFRRSNSSLLKNNNIDLYFLSVFRVFAYVVFAAGAAQNNENRPMTIDEMCMTREDRMCNVYSAFIVMSSQQ